MRDIPVREYLGSRGGSSAFFVPEIKNKFETNFRVWGGFDLKARSGSAMMRMIRKWLKRDSGTTAIEFSMMLVPYLMLMFGIMELAVMYTTASIIEGSTGSASRMIRTGQLQKSGSADPAGDFRTAFCDAAVALVRCDDVVIEATVLESYADFTPPVFDEDGNMISNGFEVGASNDRVLIRVAYRYQMLTPLVGPLLTGGSGSRLLMSTIVLQTEPYEFQGA